MSPNCANTISKHWQSLWRNPSSLRNARKLRKVVMIYKTIYKTKWYVKLILSKLSLSLQVRGSEKVPYSKRCCSKLIFFNLPVTYAMFLVSFWAIITTVEKKSHTADSALKFSTEIDISYFELKLIFDILYLNWYLNFPKSKIFRIFR